jgi:two-component system chemotaxis response regulator CheY
MQTATALETPLQAAVLVVDDSVTIREQLRAILEPAGCAVEQATNGREGLEKARAQRFDLIISDLAMPEMDGLEMIRTLRVMPGYAETPIFVLSLESMPLVIRSAKRIGATAWIIKPFNSETLLKGVRRAVVCSPK